MSGDAWSTIRGRIEAELAQAEAATGGPWGVGAAGSEGSRVNPRTGDIRNDSRYVVSCSGRQQPEDGRNAAFIAAHDPPSVKRRCLADLELLDAALDKDIGHSTIARVLAREVRRCLMDRYPLTETKETSA